MNDVLLLFFYVLDCNGYLLTNVYLLSRNIPVHSHMSKTRADVSGVIEYQDWQQRLYVARHERIGIGRLVD